MELTLLQPIGQNWSFSRIAKERPPPTWEKVFEESEKCLNHIDKQLTGKILYPLRKHTFRAFELTPLPEVKLLILGQDPYPQILESGKPKAIGLSFSIDYNDKDIPVSLKNMFKEIARTSPGFRPSHGSLIRWAQQGVLLLNSALTFDPNSEKDHTEIWKDFIVHVLEKIEKPCVALLLGGKAQAFSKHLKSNVKTVETSHPSGRSAYLGFNGSACFDQCNALLVEMGMTPIDWNLN